RVKPRARLSCICTRGLPLSLHSTVLCTTIRETARSARRLLRANACRRESRVKQVQTVYYAVPILFALTYANKCVRPMGQAIALDSKRAVDLQNFHGSGNEFKLLIYYCMYMRPTLCIYYTSINNGDLNERIGNCKSFDLARDVSPRLSRLSQRLEATYIPNVRRTDARFMTITRTKRGWPLSRSSLCILAVPSFSIGNLFRTYNPHN
ncbi:hypothetical protein ALC62_10725, partial [Cyphomyrmex costatus]